MKFSIITVSFNSAETIADTIRSVADQSYEHVEHIIIDGGSTDGTIEIIKQHVRLIECFISESDRGMYDAMNKGLKLAKGNILGFLHSDDVYFDRGILKDVADAFKANQVDAVYGDLVYVAPDDLNRVVRYYDSRPFNPDMIARGYMPAHPTLFLKEAVYKNHGYFKTDYRIAADFEFAARIFGKERLSYHYLPKVMVKMRTGGLSTRNFKSNWILNKEILKACRENNIDTNIWKILSKYPKKLMDLINSKGKLPDHHT